MLESFSDALCSKLERNLSHKDWNEWVFLDIDYNEQCTGLPIPPDETEPTAVNENKSPIIKNYN